MLFEHMSARGCQSRAEHYVLACLFLQSQKELEFHSWIFKGDSWILAFVFLVPLTLSSIGLNSLRGQSSATTSLIEFCSVGVATRLEKWTSFLGSECPLLVWRRVSGPRDNGWDAQLLSLPGRDFWLPASWASGPECSASVQWCLGVGLCSLLGSFCREIPPPPLPSLSP